jgi:hypothetical protein
MKMKFNFNFKFIKWRYKQTNKIQQFNQKIHYDIDILFIDGLNSKYALKPDADLELAVKDINQVFKKIDVVILDLDKQEWIGYYAPSMKQPIIIYHKSGLIQNIQFSYSRF